MMIIVLGSVAIGYMARDDIESLIRDVRQEDITAPEECQNLTMKETAYCLNDYVRSIFKYKSRPDTESPSIEELEEDGGDCLNWADLYVQHAENLGLYVKRPLFDTGNKTRHTFAIISDETGYCILDQIAVNCFMLGISSLENETKNI